MDSHTQQRLDEHAKHIQKLAQGILEFGELIERLDDRLSAIEGIFRSIKSPADEER